MNISRTIYRITAWLFVAGVMVQVFFAGMTVVAGQWGWANHTNLGHGLAFPILIMVVTVFTGRFPVSMKRLTLLLFGVYLLQADVLIFLRGTAPVMSALHPVLALFDFALGLLLAVRARAVRQEELLPATGDVA